MHDQLIYIFGFKSLRFELKWTDEQDKMPIWCFPLHVITSILVATLITILIEEPIRNYFSKVKNENYTET